MTYRRLALQWYRPDDEHYRLIKQNHNVSCILYKPQRLRKQTDDRSTPKHNIYGLVHAGRCLFHIIFCDDKFGQSEADRCLFRKFDHDEVEMVLVHVDDILAHAQATMERFAAELGDKFKVKSMVEKFGVEKTTRTSVYSGSQPSLQVDKSQTPEEEEDMLKLPYREAVRALMWTATMTRPDIACAVLAMTRFWNHGLARITKRRRCRPYITCFTRTNGGSRLVSRTVDSA